MDEILLEQDGVTISGRLAEDGQWEVTVSSHPSVIGRGSTKEEAAKNAMLQLFAYGMSELAKASEAMGNAAQGLAEAWPKFTDGA
jgi:predicted RNase H-like HicB family nuclease